VQSASLQTIRKRLADIRARIAAAEHRLAELENCAPDHAMSAMLIDSVTATLELLREHEARLESRRPDESRRQSPVTRVARRKTLRPPLCCQSLVAGAHTHAIPSCGSNLRVSGLRLATSVTRATELVQGWQGAQITVIFRANGWDASVSLREHEE
jgi:hypothetical protein